MRDVWDIEAIIELSDLVVYQSVLMGDVKSDKVLSGVEYIMIDPKFAQCQPDFNGPIVVSMGGGDPHDLTPKIIESLSGIDRQVDIIVGPANGHGLPNLVQGALTTINLDADSLLPFLNGASLFIGALGMSAYESAAAGVPALLSAWTEDHHATTLELQKCGTARNLGTWDKFDGDFLRSAVDGLLNDKDEWQKMSDAGKQLVDGNGVIRVVNKLEAGGNEI